MCIPIAAAAALASAAVAIGGTAYSASQSNAAAQAQINAQNEQWQAQNQGFLARNAAQNTYDNAQFDAQMQGLQAQSAATQQQQDVQTQAQQDYQKVVQETNQQQQDTTNQANQVNAQTVQQVSPEALQSAITQRAAAQTTMAAQPPPGPSVTNPVGTTADDATKQAVAKAVAIGAGKAQQYGSSLAASSSMAQPLLTGNLAAVYNQTQSAPVKAAYNIITGALPGQLLPSQTAYQSAATEGQMARGVAQTATQGALNVGQTAFQNATDIANLAQGDTTTLAQNQANLAAAQANANAKLGQTLAGIGNLGVYGATSGGLNGLGNSISSIFSGSGPAGAIPISVGGGGTAAALTPIY